MSDLFRPEVNGVINPTVGNEANLPGGIIRFTDLVIESSSAALSFIFTACFESCGADTD